MVSDLLLGQGLDDDIFRDQEKTGIAGLNSGQPTPGAGTGIVPIVGNNYNPNHLHIRERAGCVFVEGLSRSRITSVDDLKELLAKGDLNRHTASTNMNETSSRSHAALIVTIIMRDNDGHCETEVSSTGAAEKEGGHLSYSESSLIIVDLAGSER